MRFRADALLVIALTAFACSSDSRSTPSPTAPAPRPVYTGTLSGTVRDNVGQPIAGVSVYVGIDPRTGGTGGAQTDDQGRYSIGGLAGGQQYVSVSKPGYIRISTTVTIGVEVTKDFTLVPGVILGGHTTELGLVPLVGVRISVMSGPNAGTETTSSGIGVGGGWTLPPILPGDVTLRASKAGYDTIERAIHAAVDTYGIDFALKSSYGSCLTSVAPVLVDRVPSAGQTIVVAIGANGDRAWTPSSPDSWIDVPGATRTGSGTLSFRVLPNPIGAVDTRSGTVSIRCSANEGQTVYVSQLPDCQTSLEWAPGSLQIFPASGGTGRVLVHNGVFGCRSRDFSESDWIHLVGAGSYMTGEINFIVDANATGLERTGSVIVGEARWTVTERP